MSNQPLRCPQCGQIDQIRKVSSIVSGETVTGTYSGSSMGVGVPIGKGQTTVTSAHTTLSGSSQSLLSQSLTPPDRPSAKGISGCAIIAAAALFLYGCGTIMAIVSAAASGIVNHPAAIPLAIFYAVSLLTAAGGGIYLLVRANRKAKERKAQAASQMPHWNLAIDRWTKLYYCARDDGVFDPDEGVFVPIDQMMRYLYR